MAVFSISAGHVTSVKLFLQLTTTQENYETEIERASKAQRRSFDQLDSGVLDLDATVIQLEGEQNR